jgi:DNA-binding Lrp family transcriptional regulator
MEDTQNTTNPQEKKTIVEEFKVSGEAVVGRVKEIIREGNVRRITIKNEEGKTLFEIPLTFGIVGALLLPQLAALGAVGALIAKLSITIEREDDTTIVQPPSNVSEGGHDGA